LFWEKHQWFKKLDPDRWRFNLQPAELCKIFTALALAKFLSRQETEFSNLKSQLIAGMIVIAPAILIYRCNTSWDWRWYIPRSDGHVP
jgi:cell division protein FtsW (lipid II flippase)